MTKSLVLEAAVTKVKVSFLEIDGLMDETGSYYIAAPQLVDIDLIPPNRSEKQLESLLNSNSQSHFELNFVKLKTPLHPKAVNAIPLKNFEVLLARLDRKGNVKAQELRDALVGLSLHQLFCDAFGIKFEQEDRQNWLRVRMQTKETFWFMGSAIDAYYKANPRIEKFPGQNYSQPFDALNLGLFGKKSKKIKEILNIGKNQLNRDHFGEKSLKRIEMIQRIAEAQMCYHNLKPVEAVKSALALMNYATSDFKE